MQNLQLVGSVGPPPSRVSIGLAMFLGLLHSRPRLLPFHLPNILGPSCEWFQRLFLCVICGVTDTGQSQLAPILRFDKLDKTLLLGLFKGNIQEIIFQQPSEGIHFGFDIGAPDTYDKNLRYLSGEEAGKYNGQALKNIPYRPGKRNTLAVAQLANQIASQLTVTPVTEFTSAEYALEMVQSAGEVNIVNQS